MFILVGAQSVMSFNVKMVHKRPLGLFCHTDQPLTFETHVAEHIEIVSGQCQVKIGLQTEMRLYYAGESFDVPANSRFSMMASEVVDYICHLEK